MEDSINILENDNFRKWYNINARSGCYINVVMATKYLLTMRTQHAFSTREDARDFLHIPINEFQKSALIGHSIFPCDKPIYVYAIERGFPNLALEHLRFLFHREHKRDYSKRNLTTFYETYVQSVRFKIGEMMDKRADLFDTLTKESFYDFYMHQPPHALRLLDRLDGLPHDKRDSYYSDEDDVDGETLCSGDEENGTDEESSSNGDDDSFIADSDETPSVYSSTDELSGDDDDSGTSDQESDSDGSLDLAVPTPKSKKRARVVIDDTDDEDDDHPPIRSSEKSRKKKKKKTIVTNNAN